ncbi:TATA element modulatory factor [Echinococcus granulosus]|uniref:TATA element modulatory factor n=1 Tax=Echinococcus granulosus TaxID=6210 RepID=W6UZR2_ECHGR|nr:TATA element modulatory factor [Echinococcus granulosus]EUB64027.1 TATA element modulatory factor [Echinococcus granulosus]
MAIKNRYLSQCLSYSNPISMGSDFVIVLREDQKPEIWACSDILTSTNLPHLPKRPKVLTITSSYHLFLLLQSLLRQREGEVGQLRREVARLNETHERLLAALSEQTAKTNQRVPLNDSLPADEGDEGSLSQRYEVLLQLYGRKLEENEELRMDLREAKEAYQAQLNDLLNKLNDGR